MCCVIFGLAAYQEVMMSQNLIYILLLSVGASFIQTTTGFGFGIFIMTLLPYLMPSYGEATTLSGLMALTNSLWIAVKMRHYINWRHLAPILITFIIVSVPTVCLLRSIDELWMRRVLGAALILISLYFTAYAERIRVGVSLPVQICAGGVSGVMGGLFGMQGPPAVLYFISSEPTKEHYMAIAQAYFLIGNFAMTLSRAGNGFLTEAVGRGYLFGIAGVAVGTLVGGAVFARIPQKAFKRLIYLYIGLSGLVILLTS